MRPFANARDGRTLFMGIASCIVILGAGRGIPMWRQWRESAHQRLLASASSLARGEAALAARARVDQGRRHALSELIGADSLTIRSATPAAGAAQLAGIVAELTDDAHAKLNSIQIRADTATRSPMVRSSIRLSAVGDIAGLASLLQGLESGAPLLVVRELTVSQGEPLGTDDRPEQLRIELVVEGMTFLRQPDEKISPTKRVP